MKEAHSFVFIRVKSWSVARGRMDVAGRLRSCSKFLQCKNLEHDLSRAEKSCSVIWRSYDSRVQSYEDRVQSYEDRVQSYEDRVAERGKKLIQPSYVLTRLNTTFIRLSYDSHTPEHEIHTFVIRSEEPIMWLSDQNRQKYVVWRSCSVVWRSCLFL